MIDIQYVGARNPEYYPSGLPATLPAVPRVGEQVGFILNNRTVEVKQVTYHATYVVLHVE